MKQQVIRLVFKSLIYVSCSLSIYLAYSSNLKTEAYVPRIVDGRLPKYRALQPTSGIRHSLIFQNFKPNPVQTMLFNNTEKLVPLLEADTKQRQNKHNRSV
jgi:hypothetical protein